MYSKISAQDFWKIANIQKIALERSQAVLTQWETQSIHIWPIELLDKIGADGFGQYTPQISELYRMMKPKDENVDINGYKQIFSQWIATHLVDEASILKFVNHEGYGENWRPYNLN